MANNILVYYAGVPVVLGWSRIGLRGYDEVYNVLGYNYRLSDINCALGIAQLERIEEILVKRERVARWYNKQLGEVDGVRVPHSSSWAEKLVCLCPPAF